ncbi:MAG: hypothetical protein IPK15_22745 [Verrucomicrobia bacterium]|nr:hypothetical protein [Verrucomicrobiota bacterium]
MPSRPVVLRGAIQLSSLLCLALLFGPLAASASPSLTNVFINELLFKPTFGDTTNEVIELRGPPNLVLPDGTYLLGVEGDEDDDPARFRTGSTSPDFARSERIPRSLAEESSLQNHPLQHA